MPNTFLISDTHFGHTNICRFLRSDETTKLRPWDDVQEMDEAFVKNWNEVVRPEDKVYHLGDVVINRKALPIMKRLMGKKRLIRGNHDIFDTMEYLEYFDNVYGVRVLEDMILSHIPLHPESVTKRFKTNVHGHLHDRAVLNSYGHVDSRYFSVCVERINFTPIEITEVRQKIKENQKHAIIV